MNGAVSTQRSSRRAIGRQSARNMLTFFDARAPQGVIDLFTQAGQGGRADERRGPPPAQRAASSGLNQSSSICFS